LAGFANDRDPYLGETRVVLKPPLGVIILRRGRGGTLRLSSSAFLCALCGLCGSIVFQPLPETRAVDQLHAEILLAFVLDDIVRGEPGYNHSDISEILRRESARGGFF
jgi:hypothetical protein